MTAQNILNSPFGLNWPLVFILVFFVCVITFLGPLLWLILLKNLLKAKLKAYKLFLRSLKVYLKCKLIYYKTIKLMLKGVLIEYLIIKKIKQSVQNFYYQIGVLSSKLRIKHVFIDMIKKKRG